MSFALLAAGGLMVADAAAQYVYEGRPTFPLDVVEESFRERGPDGQPLPSEADVTGEKPDPRKSVPPIAPLKPFGVFVMIGEKGLVAVSPTAPPSLGYGENNLTATFEQRGFSTVSGDHQQIFPYGGLVLFGWEF